MESTLDFLERLKAKHDNASDYKAAQILGVAKQTVSNWRNGKTMDDESALLFAAKLDLNPAYVIACAHAERSKSEVITAVWQDIANNFAACYALVFIGFLGVAGLL